MNFYKRLVKGTIWNAVAQILNQLISFGVTIVLARVLLPEDFGLVGKIIVITGFAGYFVEFGFTPSLVLSDNFTEDTKSTAFWAVVFFTLITYLVIYVSAPLVAVFYNDDRLVLITRVIFLEFLFRPMAIVPVAIDSRNVRYDRIAISHLVSSIVSGVTALTCAFIGLNVWALIIQSIVRSIVFGLALSIMVGWYPKIHFSLNDFRQLFNVGYHFTVENMVKYVSENIDFLMVGKIMNNAALGVYTMAFRLSRYLVSKLWAVFGKMIFPSFVSIKSNEVQIREKYLQLSVIMTLIIMPALALYYIIVDELVLLLLGERWEQSVVIVKILLPYIAFEALTVMDPGLLGSKKKIHIVYIIRILVIMMVGPIGYWALIKSGLSGIASVYTIVFILGFLVLKKLSLNILQISVSNYLRAHRQSLTLFTLSLLFPLIFHKIASYLELSEIVDSSVSVAIWFSTIIYYIIKHNYVKKFRPNLDEIFRNISQLNLSEEKR